MIKDINPVQLLTELSSSQSNGYLNVDNGSASWRIYFKEGDLKYIDCSIQSMSELTYYLSRQGWDSALAAVKSKFQSHPHLSAKSNLLDDPFKQTLFEQIIIWLQSEEYINGSQVKQLIEDKIKNTLESFLWLNQARLSWVNSPCIKTIGETTSFDLANLVKLLRQRLTRWQSCAPGLWSPHQRPYLVDYRQIEKPIPSGKLSVAALKKLAQLMRGLSIRQISLVLKQDELQVAQLLSPYIKHGVIYLRNPQTPLDRLPKIPKALQNKPQEKFDVDRPTQNAGQIYKIVCVDDSPTILNEMERFLGKEKFQVTTINDPIQASSVIFRIKPDLILLDITMPKINGYKLCSLLRSSAVFNETPIIMVTGNKGLIDKARAKLVGSTDYLTKPFTQKGLIDLVDKYLEPIGAIH